MPSTKENESSSPLDKRPPIAISVAGTDPSGGAGIQADLKTFTARNVVGTTVITALVAQNTHGVSRVQGIAEDFVQDQFNSVLNDMPVDATKSGMLDSRALVEMLIHQRQTQDLGFYVADPVMVSTSGHQLLDDEAIYAFRYGLLPLVDLITPNLPEAALLLGEQVPEAQSVTQMEDQAQELIQRGVQAVLLKGGHASSDKIVDVLMTKTGLREYFYHRRINTKNTHGTGCTLSAAITADVASLKRYFQTDTVNDDRLYQAVSNALEYLSRALASSAGWSLSLDPAGAHGPVNHQVDIEPVTYSY